MSLISRVKRLWELSGTLSDAEDTKTANKLKFHSETKRKRKKLATILADNPLDIFPEADENNDTTSERSSSN